MQRLDHRTAQRDDRSVGYGIRSVVEPFEPGGVGQDDVGQLLGRRSVEQIAHHDEIQFIESLFDSVEPCLRLHRVRVVHEQRVRSVGIARLDGVERRRHAVDHERIALRVHMDRLGHDRGLHAAMTADLHRDRRSDGRGIAAGAALFVEMPRDGSQDADHTRLLRAIVVQCEVVALMNDSAFGSGVQPRQLGDFLGWHAAHACRPFGCVLLHELG